MYNQRRIPEMVMEMVQLTPRMPWVGNPALPACEAHPDGYNPTCEPCRAAWRETIAMFERVGKLLAEEKRGC